MWSKFVAAELDVVVARLEADESYQTLKAKESVLDLQVRMLQQKLRVAEEPAKARCQSKETNGQPARKMCQELEARREKETDKFRALETMAIIKNVDNHPQPIPKPHKKWISHSIIAPAH
ncbi:hypothetical protein H257_15745 [Aphanomyces astaci]|uniref:Uncharacterized protein n=1 Tax=Aphanomyces astaci TaxID=112090 RepID=W4FNN4_APHAT|nr:hypothetical protein H257_15745 [Aphanomyces astaci]ETV68303.1 hypothetical protein H257_15745 [Aphanomyces astaci]|eukprot:XP_009842246.1 hypothetical protein H257_15745 [Aphanomyces astaci]